MRRLLSMSLALLLAGLVTAQEKKGSVIRLDGAASTTPVDWVKEEPSNKMRFAQFRLPKAAGDKEDAELIIFKGLGGSAAANLDRWKQQFVAPKGKSIEDVSEVRDVKIAGINGKLLDVEGTYMFNPAPFNPRSKPEPRPGYRMLAIHYEGPEDVYHIKLTGPAKTIEKHKKGFEDWLQGFKK